MNIADKAWTAGIVDGEGCISIKRDFARGINKAKFGLSVIVANTDVLMLEKLKKLWGGNISFDKIQLSNRDAWRWSLSSKNAMLFLQKIYLFLICKQKQADLGIKFQTRLLNKVGMVRIPIQYKTGILRQDLVLSDMERAFRCRMYWKMRELKI